MNIKGKMFHSTPCFSDKQFIAHELSLIHIWSERRVVLKLLKAGINPKAIFHDLYIQKPNGTYTQVDVAAVSYTHLDHPLGFQYRVSGTGQSPIDVG